MDNITTPEEIVDQAFSTLTHSPLIEDQFLSHLEKREYAFLRTQTRLNGAPSSTSFMKALTRLSSEPGIKQCVVITQILKYGFQRIQEHLKDNVAHYALQTMRKVVDKHVSEDHDEQVPVLLENWVQIISQLYEMGTGQTEIRDAVVFMEQYEGSMDPGTRGELSSISASLKLLNRNLGSDQQDEGAESEPDTPLHEQLRTRYEGGLLRSQRRNVATIKPHAVRMQQQTCAKSQEMHSEETVLANLNLNSVLAARSRTIQTGLHREPLPPAKTKDGSDRGWFTTTFTDIQTLLNRAKRGDAVSQNDQDYLYDKMKGWQFKVSATREELNVMIVETFYNISKGQLIKRTHCTKLLKKMCKSNKIELCKFILLCAQNTFKRVPGYYDKAEDEFLSKKLKSINQSMFKDMQLELETIILEIMAQQSSNQSQQGTDIFLADKLESAFERAKSSSTDEKTRQVCLTILGIHSMKPSSMPWFNINIPRIVNLAVETEGGTCRAESKFWCQWIEIVENCLNHKNSFGVLDEQSVQDLASYLSTDSSRSPDNLEALLRLILKCGRQKSLSVTTLGQLVEVCIKSGNERMQAIIAVTLVYEVTTLPNNATELAMLLGNELNIPEDLLPSELEGTMPTFDMLIASVLRQWALTGKVLNESPLMHIIHYLETSEDTQALISLSQFLSRYFCRADVQTCIEEPMMKSLLELTNDSSPDVRLHCRRTVVAIAGKRSRNIIYDLDVSEGICSLYAFDRLVMDGKDYTEEINNGVVSFLLSDAGKTGKKYGPKGFSLFLFLLGNNGDIHPILEALKTYTRNGNPLPADIKVALYPLLESGATELIQSIFEALIKSGEVVENRVVEWYISEKLMKLQKNCLPVLTLLWKCHNNQDLPGHMFDLLVIEIMCNKGDLLWDHLQKYLSRGGIPSPRLLSQIEKFLSKKDTMEACWESLRLIAENGQYIPDECLKKCCDVIPHSDFLEFLQTLLANGQSLPSSVVKYILTKPKEQEAQRLATFVMQLYKSNQLRLEDIEILTSIQVLMSQVKREIQKGLLPVLVASLEHTKKQIPEVMAIEVFPMLLCFIEDNEEVATLIHTLRGITLLCTNAGLLLQDNDINKLLSLHKESGVLREHPAARILLKSIMDSQKLTDLQLQEVGLMDLCNISKTEAFLEEFVLFFSIHGTMNASEAFQMWPPIFEQLTAAMGDVRCTGANHEVYHSALSLYLDADRNLIPAIFETCVNLFTTAECPDVLKLCEENVLKTIREELAFEPHPKCIQALEKLVDRSYIILKEIMKDGILCKLLSSKTKLFLMLKDKTILNEDVAEIFEEIENKIGFSSDHEIVRELLENLQDQNISTSSRPMFVSILAHQVLKCEKIPEAIGCLNAFHTYLKDEKSLTPQFLQAAEMCIKSIDWSSEPNDTVVETLQDFVHLVLFAIDDPEDKEMVAPTLQLIIALPPNHDVIDEGAFKCLNEIALRNFHSPLGFIRSLTLEALLCVAGHEEGKYLIRSLVTNMAVHLQRQALAAGVHKDSRFVLYLRRMFAVDKPNDPTVFQDLEILQVLLLVDHLDIRRMGEAEMDKWMEILLLGEIIASVEASRISQRLELLGSLQEVKKWAGTMEATCAVWKSIVRILQQRMVTPDQLNDFLDLLMRLPTSLALNQILNTRPRPGWYNWLQATCLHYLAGNLKTAELCSLLQTKFGVCAAARFLQQLQSSRQTNAERDLALIFEITQTLSIPSESNVDILDSLRCQAITSLLQGLPKEKAVVNTYIRAMLKKGTDFKVVVDFVLAVNSSADFLYIIKTVYNHGLTSKDVASLTKILKQSSKDDILPICSDFCNKVTFQAGTNGTLKETRAIVEELAEIMGRNDDVEYKQNMESLVHDVSSGLVKSLTTNKYIRDWEEVDILQWANFLKILKGAVQVNHDFCKEAIAVANRAFKLAKGFQLSNVQILSIYMGVNKGFKGRLLQIATGAGKSAITAILATITALRGGFTVDIVTSSPVLAQRDAENWTKFYEMFGLTCASNGEVAQYISGIKKCYESNIVYGDISDFQFDVLRHEYADLSTLGQRKAQFVIVDEVDNMLLDDVSKLARLSSPLPGMDSLQFIFHSVWNRLHTVETKLFTVGGKTYYINGQVEYESGFPVMRFADSNGNICLTKPDLVSFIRFGEGLEDAGVYELEDVEEFVKKHLMDFTGQLLEKGNLNLPKHLQDFATSQIPRWVESCITAYGYQENVHYIVDRGAVKPIDFSTTGIIQDGTAWADGLHQFLQLKHNLAMTTESVTTNFLSNFAFFRRYTQVRGFKKMHVQMNDCNIVGLTGTLGNSTVQEALSKLYGTASTVMPRPHVNQYVQYPDVLCKTEVNWLSEILSSAKCEALRGRGILIICETIKDVYKIERALKPSIEFFTGVRLYTKNNSNQEQEIERIKPGEIFVATNLAGRGTDIKTQDIEGQGGLHVCLTYMPKNGRVEEQAFGRTARQGNKGSGQLVCISEQQEGCEIRASRDKMEELSLASFMKNEYPSLSAKDSCFFMFCRFLRKCRSRLKGKNTNVGFRDLCILQAIEEQWAFFLRKLDLAVIIPEEAVLHYSVFRLLLSLKFNKNSSTVIKSPYYHVIIGNDYFDQGKDTAISHFQAAINLDPVPAAYMGLGYVLLQTAEGTCYKTQAIGHFEKALSLIQGEIGQLVSAQGMLRQRTKDINSPLFSQLATKVNIMGSISNNIQAALEVTKRSLRTIDVEVTTNGVRGGIRYLGMENRTDNVKGVVTHLVSEYTKKDERTLINLKFNDLTLHNDAGTKDQAVNTIASSDLNANETLKIRSNDLNFSKMTQLFSPNSVRMKVEKGSALEVIENWKNTYTWRVGRALSSSGNFVVARYTDSDAVQMLGEKIHYEDAKKLVQGFRDTDVFNLAYVGGNSNNVLDKTTTVSIVTPHLSVAEGCSLLELFGGQYATMNLAMPASTKEQIHARQKALEGSEMFESVSIRVGSADNKTWSFEDDLHKGKFNPDESYEIYGFNMKNDVEKLRDTLKPFTDNGRISFTFHGVNTSIFSRDPKISATEGKNKVSKLLNAASLILTPSVDKAAAVVNTLRSQKIEFSLEFCGLSINRAKYVIEDANISQEKIILSTTEMKNIYGIFTPDMLPLTELGEFAARGFLLLPEFRELSPIPWWSIGGLVILASVQTIFGGLLICTGVGASFGLSLITEGLQDFYAAYKAYSNRQFSWNDYAIQKAVSYTVTVCTLGLSKMKDAAKGVKMIASETRAAGNALVKKAASLVGKEVATTAATASSSVIILGGKEVTKLNLATLVAKQVAVQSGQIAARHALNYAVDEGMRQVMATLKPSLLEKVTLHVKDGFTRPELSSVVSILWALDAKKLNAMVRSAVSSVTNRQTNEYKRLWDSVALPLLQGIFSDPNTVGYQFMKAVRIIGILKALTEVVTVTDTVLEKIRVNLERGKPAALKILHDTCKLPLTVAQSMAPSLKCEIVPGEVYCQYSLRQGNTDVSPNELKTVNAYIEKMNKTLKNFKIQNADEAIQSTSIGIADSILKTIEMEMVKPVTSSMVGSIVSEASGFIESNYLVADGKSGTVRQEIEAAAKDYYISYLMDENQAKIDEALANQRISADGKQQDQDVEQMAIEVGVGGKPASATDMAVMAKQHGVDLLMVREGYILTEEDKASGKPIVLYKRNPDDPQGIGHYQLYDKAGDKFVDVPSEYAMDCGYKVMEKITGVPATELRMKEALIIIDSPTQFQTIGNNEAWIWEHDPAEACWNLMVGGAKKEKPAKRRNDENSSTKRRQDGGDNAGGEEEQEIEGEPTILLYIPHTFFDEDRNPILDDNGFAVGEQADIARYAIPVGLTSGQRSTDAAREVHTAPFPGYRAGHSEHEDSGGLGNQYWIHPTTPSANYRKWYAEERHLHRFQEEAARRGLAGQGTIISTLTFDYEEYKGVVPSDSFTVSHKLYSANPELINLFNDIIGDTTTSFRDSRNVPNKYTIGIDNQPGVKSKAREEDSTNMDDWSADTPISLDDDDYSCGNIGAEESSEMDC